MKQHIACFIQPDVDNELFSAVSDAIQPVILDIGLHNMIARMMYA